MAKSTVIIEVSGGVAEVTHSDRNINVVVVDWDNLSDGGSDAFEEASWNLCGGSKGSRIYRIIKVAPGVSINL